MASDLLLHGLTNERGHGRALLRGDPSQATERAFRKGNSGAFHDIMISSMKHVGQASNSVRPSFCYGGTVSLPRYSTVTDLARFRGWSTWQPRMTAMW